MLQTSQKINLREERDFSEKLNATFRFIKLNFRPLLRVLLLYVTPVALTAGILSGLYQARLFRTLGSDKPYSTLGEYSFFNQVTSLHYLLTLFFMFLGYVLVCLTVYGFMVVYMDEETPVQPAAVWAHVKQNLVQALYSSIALAVVSFLGIFLLGLGLYLGVVFSLFLIVMVREETGFVETLERCFHLIKGNWWATFGLLLMVGLIQGVFTWLTALPVGVVTLMRMFQIPGAESDLLLVVASAISSVLGIYIYSLSAIALAFQYFNLVEQKDGLGLLTQVDMIGRRDLNATANEGEF
ncbi:hypothetical protein [Pontibacter chitinilyticus]|uniref:hypothetical protein n=1 Tax=Pontibacter chitinilyticus TaxID=2674989 RepID=UPI00321B7A2D